MGTFKIQGASASLITKSGSWGGGTLGYDAARPTDDASLAAGINSILQNNPSLYAGWVSGGSLSSATGEWLIRFIFDLGASIISLDGGPLISFQNLPSGAMPLTAILSIRVARYANVSGDVAGALYLQHEDVADESANLGQVDSTSPVVKNYTYPNANKGFVTVVNNFGIRCVFVTQGSVGQLFFDAEVNGTYVIVSSKSVMDPPSGNVSPGDIVTIEGPDLPADINFMNSHGIYIPITILTQNSNQIRFIVPVGSYGPHTVFSGSVPLGTLTVLLINASGIYTLIPGKTNDTLYDNDSAPETMDVMIPSPFIKTGFIGG